MRIGNPSQLLENEGIEIYPDDDGDLTAMAIVNQTVSSKVQNKMNSYGVKKFLKEPSPLKLKTTKAVLKDLKNRGRLKDVSTEFNIDPRPDLTFNASGDVIVTPDNGKPAYRIPGEEVDEFMENRKNSKKRVKEAKSFPREGDQGRGDYLASLASALEDILYPTTRDEEGRVIVETDVGNFNIDYIDGEWLYVVNFTGFDMEFTLYRKHSEEVIEVIENTVENEVDAYLEEYYNMSNPPFGGDPIEIEPNYGYEEVEPPEHDMGEMYGVPYGASPEEALKYFESKSQTRKSLNEEDSEEKYMTYKGKTCGWFKEDGVLFFNRDVKAHPNDWNSYDRRALPDLKKRWKADIDKELAKNESTNMKESEGRYDNAGRYISKKRDKILSVLESAGIEYEDGSQCVDCPIITGNDVGWSSIEKAKAWFARKGIDIGFGTIDGLYYYGFLNLDDEDAQLKYDKYMENKDEEDDDFSDFGADLLICWY